MVDEIVINMQQISSEENENTRGKANSWSYKLQASVQITLWKTSKQQASKQTNNKKNKNKKTMN